MNREQAKIYYTGKIFDTNQCGKVEVIKYSNAKKVFIKFIDTGYIRIVQLSTLKKGEVLDKSIPTLYGIGIVDIPAYSQGTPLTEYILWSGMFDRCYNEKLHKIRPTYKDCQVSEDFKKFSRFKSWCNNQYGFGFKDDNDRQYQLDKDILIKDNKIYSSEACCFVPHEINSLFTHRRHSTSDKFPFVRECKKTGKYKTAILRFGVNTHLGSFQTPEEAFYAYKIAKEAHIKVVANKWKDRIDNKVYNALMNYEVHFER